MKYISILVLIATTVCIVTATVDSTYDYFPLVQGMCFISNFNLSLIEKNY